MINGLQVFDPAIFNGNTGPDPAFASLNAQEDKLSDGIGTSFGVIHIKGSKWSLQYQGQRKQFIRADDKSELTYLDVVILRKAGHKTKTWYTGFDGEQSEGKRPDCASRNGKTPDPDVANPQSEFCMTCPRNAVKLMPDGRRRKECKDYINLAVLLMPTMTMPLYGTAMLEPVLLRVPPDSLTNLAAMGDTMEQMGHHYASYVTRLTFEQGKGHPKIIFKAVQKLTGKEAEIILPLREDMQSLRITNEDDSFNGSGPKLVPPQAPLPPARVETGLVEAKTAPVVAAPVITVEPAQVTGSVMVAPVTKELDDKITNLLKTLK